MPTAIDLFAGLGGWSTGARNAGIDVIWAANHWPVAVEWHSANHPEAIHICQDLHQEDWSKVPAHDIMLASPCCQGHSKARGKKSGNAQHDASRSTAWAVVSAAEHHRPEVVLVENVEEFTDWALFRPWSQAMAVTQEERTAKLAEKRQELGEQELRHTVPYGTRQMLDELMCWHEVEEVSEAVQLLVLNGRAEDMPPAPPKVKSPSDIIRHYFRQGMRDRLAALTAGLGETKDRATIWRLIVHAHSLGPEKSAPLFQVKRHGYDISENVARKLRQAGFAESLQMNTEDDDERIA